ncbi:MAG: prolyl oligopeptidase family serine peptidase [Acidobacteriota bacterium]
MSFAPLRPVSALGAALMFLAPSLAGARAGRPAGAVVRRAVTPEIALSFTTGDRNARFSAANLSPTWIDSRRLVFARPDRLHPEQFTIEVLDTVSGTSTPRGSGSDPLPSPDGKTLAFMQGKGTLRQIWLMAADGTNRRALTRNAHGLGGWAFNFAWSPDSRSIAYCDSRNLEMPADRRPDDAKKKGPPASTVVVYGSPRDAPPPSEIWLVDVARSAERKIAEYPTSLTALSWFPDGRRLLMYGFRQGSMYREAQDSSDVITIDTATGQRRDLVHAGGEEMYGAVSPNGSEVAFYYDRDDVRYPDLYEVALVPSAGGPVQSLTKKLATRGRPLWSPDGRGVYYTASAGAFRQVFSVSRTGEIRQVTSSPANRRNLTVSPDGRSLAWNEESVDGRKSLVVARSDGSEARQVLNLTPEFDDLVLGAGREVRWKSKDGLEIAGILVTPPDYVEGKAYPLFVEPHGGPVGGVSVGGQMMFAGPLERQIWAAKGIVVFAPDFRTSGVYGWDPILSGREKQDFMERDFDDIETGVDSLIAAGIADPKRMVVGGHSYGAVETEWIITHSHRYRAAVAYEGDGDWYRAYGDLYSVGGNTSLMWQFRGRPWEVPERYFQSSAMYQMKGATIPTLFIVGDGTEYGGSYPSAYEFMYSALKQQGVETEMLLYKKEGHVVSRPENVRDLTTRVLDWVERHLTGPGAR